jgi:hypothetical protein
MLFDPELFDPPLFEDEAPVTVAPAPIFPVTRDDAGTPYTFTAPIKDPASIERHGMDWSAWLQQGDAIASIDVTVDLQGLEIDQEDHQSGIVIWRLQGGALGQDYIVTCQITTASGLVDERSVRYRVRER